MSAFPDLLTTIVPLRGSDPTLPSDDLEMLRGVVLDARIVGLGESTHGQSEVYLLRHRISRYLVEHMGFTVIAIEANATECEAADRFVGTGEGSAAEAAMGMSYWLYRTEEMRDFLLWAREWNKNCPAERRVSIAGIDAQRPATAANRIAERLTGDDIRSGQVRTQIKALANLSLWERQPSEPSTTDLRATLGLARELVTGSESDVRFLEQFLLKRDAPTAESRWDIRDHTMADNVLRIASNSKVIVWAHNGHVTKDAGWLFETTLTPMGFHLAHSLAERYVSIGCAFGSGALRAVVGADSDNERIDTVILEGPPPDSLDAALLSAIGPTSGFLDLRSVGGGLRAWLDQPLISRTTGADFISEEETHATPNVMRCYDALVFVGKTTGTRPLWRERTETPRAT